MTIEVVDPAVIEDIVGIERHLSRHYGRAVSNDMTFYILHSQQCVNHYTKVGKDLTNCYFSVALAEGLNPSVWKEALDRPVKIGLDGGGRIAPIDVWEGKTG